MMPTPMRILSKGRSWLAGLLSLAATMWLPAAAGEPSGSGGTSVTAGFRSPVDLAGTADGKWIVTANAASASVSLVDVAGNTVVDELAIGRRPTAVACRGAGRFVAVAAEAGDLVAFNLVDGRLVTAGRVHLGFEPHGVALSPDGNTAYVTLSAVHRLAIVDLVALQLVDTVDVGTLPRWPAVSPDGGTIAVTCTGRAELLLIDAASRTVRERHLFQGFNVGQPAFSPDGATVYFTFTYDGGSYPAPGNISRGWVTGSRLGRLQRVGSARLEGLTLDVAGRAVADVLGTVVADSGGSILITAGGTHELLRLDASRLPWNQISSSEVMDASLASDADRFRRIALGGRPLGIRVFDDGRRAYVANALLDAIQEVDLRTCTVVHTIPIDRGHEPSAQAALVRRGETIFYDAHRSLQQWYSCHTCHHEGGGNTVTFDTLNDGSIGTYKTVLPLWDVVHTGPWTWHGWQTNLRISLRKSLIESMQGPTPTEEDVTAMEAFLATLQPPPSPFREADGGLSPAASRGRELFASDRAGCANCHAGKHFTSPELYDVGLSRRDDRYPGFNPPPLAGGFRKTMFLHHGKAKSLPELLTGLHGPDKVSGLPPLSSQEVDDLVAYLKSL